jgi:hypothetical protein
MKNGIFGLDIDKSHTFSPPPELASILGCLLWRNYNRKPSLEDTIHCPMKNEIFGLGIDKIHTFSAPPELAY